MRDEPRVIFLYGWENEKEGKENKGRRRRRKKEGKAITRQRS